MLSRAAAATVLLLVLPLSSGSSGAPAEPPVAVVHKFLAALKSRNCERAWTYFSAASRAYIECKSKELTASAPYDADRLSAHNLYCLPTASQRYHSYQPSTARLKSLTGGRAVVSVERLDPDGFLLPGFFPAKKKIVSAEIVLTDEEDRWTIQVPSSATGPRSTCTPPPAP